MSNTVSASAFRTVCAAVADAIDAQDWALAGRKYAVAEALNAGLDSVAQHGPSRTERRDTLKGLADAIEVARRLSSQQASQGRFITTQTGFPR